MNNPFPSNSNLTYEPVIGNLGYRMLSSVEMQSPSITSGSSLREEILAHPTYEKSFTTPQNSSNRNESYQGTTLSPENQALIQLLRSWRESDDEERIETWKYLKHALDEDRLSDRKLFP
jgi:hypothetical protein